MLKTLISKQFLKYIIVGFIGTGLDFTILYIGVEFFHFFYFYAAIISIMIVVIISFSLNKYWTFRNYAKGYFIQLGKYIIAHGIGIGINIGILTLLVEVFDVWYILAKVFATAVSAIINFLLVKKLIFFDKKDTN